MFEVEEDEKLTSDMDAPAKTATVRGWRASEATQLNRLVIALFDSQALVFQSVTQPVLRSLPTELVSRGGSGSFHFCPNFDLELKAQAVLIADYPPPDNWLFQGLLRTTATVILWSAFALLGLRVQLVDILDMSIKPAILANLVRAWPGGRRGLYEPYLATTVNFIRQCGDLGVPVVIWGLGGGV